MTKLDDSYTKALLHFDGADASTTFTDESGKSWTAASNAQIDTAQSVFDDRASGLFDGTDDYISTADSADWNLDDGSNANKWTIDCWIRFASINRQHMICEQYATVNNYWRFFVWYDTGVTYLRFQLVSGGGTVVEISHTWSPSADTWYHLAVVKDGTNGYAMFIDGIKVTGWTTDTDTIGDLAGALTIGGSNNYAPYWMSGWIDEFRLSKGVARWTTDFTPQTYPYCAGGQVI